MEMSSVCIIFVGIIVITAPLLVSAGSYGQNSSGCPSGQAPVLDPSTGEPLIDPITGSVKCQPIDPFGNIFGQ